MKKIIILSLIISLFSCQTKTSNQNNFTIDSIKGGIIYEVNIRQYSKSGTFNEFTQDIPKIKELGVKILWLMPIHPISKKRRKGELG
ncbi:MAG: alpha-amylase, partial [Flavobacteriaceae bacterium]|nr:alpha-amylase [Flavobacteriaceae bacterium]